MQILKASERRKGYADAGSCSDRKENNIDDLSVNVPLSRIILNIIP